MHSFRPTMNDNDLPQGPSGASAADPSTPTDPSTLNACPLCPFVAVSPTGLKIHTTRKHPPARSTQAGLGQSSVPQPPVAGPSTARASAASATFPHPQSSVAQAPPAGPPAAGVSAAVTPLPESLASIIENIILFRKKSKLISIIPRCLRAPVGQGFVEVLNAACSLNSVAAWSALYSFPTAVLSIPLERVRGRSLSSLIRENLVRFHRERTLPARPPSAPRSRPTVVNRPGDSLARLVQLKVALGDVSAPARTLISTDVTAPFDDATRLILESKHPDMPTPASYPPPPRPPAAIDEIRLSESEVRAAVLSFPNSSAGGPDGLRPRHLKDLMEKDNSSCSRRSRGSAA